MASQEHSEFHFSPRPNRAHEIRWRPWGPQAFQQAQQEDKPILLGISAVWCHWCHVMDETSYSDEQIIQFINERFVPVRVDNDQRPDVNARYNMGGWPTTAFLTPDGEVLAGMTYVPPDQLRQVLDQLSTYYRENREEIGQKVEEARQRHRQAAAETGGQGAPSDQIFQDVLAAINDVYDPVHGGFGSQPKFPHTESIDLLLYAHLRRNDPDLLHMARKTLEQMAGGGVFDHVWGGFFRYATNSDWSVPHFEKMLEDNANLLRNLLRLFHLLADLLPVLLVVGAELVEHLAELVGRDVGHAGQHLAVGGEEGGGGPAAHVVASVDVGPLVVIDADGDEPLVDELDDLLVRVGRLVHHMAPVAPDGGDAQEDGLVLLLRLLERLRPPRPPADLVGAVGPGREVELGVLLRGHGSLLPVRVTDSRLEGPILSLSRGVKGGEFHPQGPSFSSTQDRAATD